MAYIQAEVWQSYWESKISKTEWRQRKKRCKQRSISIRQLINYDILRTWSTWLPQKVNASSVSLCLLHPFLVHIKNKIAYIWIENILLKIYAYNVYREHRIHTCTRIGGGCDGNFCFWIEIADADVIRSFELLFYNENIKCTEVMFIRIWNEWKKETGKRVGLPLFIYDLFYHKFHIHHTNRVECWKTWAGLTLFSSKFAFL